MILLPASAFVLCCILYALSLKAFPRLGLLDFPERYGLSRKKVPYPTGIIAIFVFLIFFPLLVTITPKEAGLIAGVLILGITCFIDDRRQLPPWLRLLVQVLSVFLIFALGSRVYTITSPLGGFLKLDSFVVVTPFFGSLPVLSGLFTVGWLLLTINAMNWFDGISGQVSVLSALGFLMLGLLSQFRNGEMEVALLSYTLAGIAMSGALFDFPPGKMLLGDSGAMFFGLLLGLLGVYQGGKVATIFLVLGIPLLDAAFVILLRILHGKSPLKGGRDHLHHKLLDAGFSERTIVIGTAILGAAFGGTALFLSTPGKFIAALILVLVVGGLHFTTRRV